MNKENTLGDLRLTMWRKEEIMINENSAFFKFLDGQITADEYDKYEASNASQQNCNCEHNHQQQESTSAQQPTTQKESTSAQQAPTASQQPTMQMFNFVQGQQAPTYVSGNVHLDNLFAICCSPAMIDQTIIAGNELLALLKDAKMDEEMINNMSNTINQIVSILKNPAASRAVAKALGVEFGFIDPATVSPDDPDLVILKDMSESITKLFNDGKTTNKNVA